MRMLGTALTVIAALIWSVVVWGGYGLLSWSAGFVARNADGVGLPADVGGLAALLEGLLRDYGTGAAAVAWVLGLLVILALRALLNAILRLVGRAKPPAPAPVPVLSPVLARQPGRPRPDAVVVRAPTAPEPAATPSPTPTVVVPPASVTPARQRWGRNATR